MLFAGKNDRGTTGKKDYHNITMHNPGSCEIISVFVDMIYSVNIIWQLLFARYIVHCVVRPKMFVSATVDSVQQT